MRCENEKYMSLSEVLDAAYDQAANGKGKERHANDEPFEDQIICQLTRWGCDYPIGQICKKAIESLRMDNDAAIRELYGVINYAAAKIIVLKEQKQDEAKSEFCFIPQFSQIPVPEPKRR